MTGRLGRFVAGAGAGRPCEILVRSGPDGSGTDLRGLMPAMGTRVHLRILDVPERTARRAAAEAFAQIDRVERLASIHDPDSPVSWMNRLAGREMIRLGPLLLDLLRTATDLAVETGGTFDLTALPLLQAWGFHGYRFDRPPRDEDRARALEVVGVRHVVLVGDAAGLATAGAGVDLGSVAKGFAIDRAVDALRRFGVQRAIVEAGGDLYALGRPRDREGWRIGLRHPLRPGWCAFLPVCDAAVATSAAGEAFVEYGGRRFGHVMDPRSGRPAEACLSASVVASSATAADAWATALFVSGDPGILPPGTGWLQVQGGRDGRIDVGAGGAVSRWTRTEEGETSCT